jgi:hypothetical protein
LREAPTLPSGLIGDVKNKYAAIGMDNVFNVHSKSDSSEHFFCCSNRDWEGLSADNLAWRLIRYSKKKHTATLIRQGDTVFVQLTGIKLLLRFLEFQPLVLRDCLPPEIDLLRSRAHDSTCTSIFSASGIRRSPEMSLGRRKSLSRDST